MFFSKTKSRALEDRIRELEDRTRELEKRVGGIRYNIRIRNPLDGNRYGISIRHDTEYDPYCFMTLKEVVTAILEHLKIQFIPTGGVRTLKKQKLP